MPTKFLFSFNEEIEAERIISKGFSDGKVDYSKMILLAKYFREKMKYGKIRLEKELVKFCLQYDKNFNPITEASNIKKWVYAAMNYKMRVVNEICLTDKEISFLLTIEDKKERRILFTTLVLGKALHQRPIEAGLKKYDNCYIWYGNIPDIVRLSEISHLREIDVINTFHKYKEHFTFYSPEKQGIRLDFSDLTGRGTIIEDLTSLALSYETIFGNPCKRCGNRFSKSNSKSNAQIYCPTCAKLVKKEKTLERVRRFNANKRTGFSD